MQTRLLYLFTRTPLHIGAGANVGAIDQPIQRERHTGFPIIPASSLKGSFANQWPTPLRNEKDDAVRVVEESKARGDTKAATVTTLVKKADKGDGGQNYLAHESAWLFGSDTTELSFAGSLIFSEARIIAFPIRSAKGSYAWITCPLMLQRAKRDGVLSCGLPVEPHDEQAIYKMDGPLALGDKIVLEEYCLTHAGTFPADLAKALAALVDDDLFQSIEQRLVILSNGMMSHFATTACDVAQHVRISDETGTADGGGLYNQENVPSDTLFYSVLSAVGSRVPNGAFNGEALSVFAAKVASEKVFQFGADASTGLGFCSATTDIQQKEA